MPDYIYTFDDPPSDKDLNKAIYVLEHDGVIAYPTEINWAFGCCASNPKAIDKIRFLKPLKSQDKPFSILCSSISMASQYAIIEDFCYRILKKIWPGPYTVLLPSSKKLARQLNDKRKVIGVRIPNSPLLLSLIDKYQKPILTTSAPPYTNGNPIKFGIELFKLYENNKFLDLILDLGKEVPGIESSIIDFTLSYPIVVRKRAGDVSFIL